MPSSSDVLKAPNTEPRLDPSEPLAEVLHTEALGLATEQSGVPWISAVIVRNPRPEILRGINLDVELPLELGGELNRKLPEVPGRGELRTGAIDHGVALGLFARRDKSERSTIRWQLKCIDQVLARGEFSLDLLAWDEWPGLRVPPGVLAPFATPDHPGLVPIVQAATLGYQKATGAQPSGYADRSSERVRALLAAVHDAIVALAVAPVPLRADYDRTGLRVRLADTVARDRQASTLDLALLAAGAAEYLGLNPIVVLLQDRALVGAWLVEERFPEGVVDDASRLRNLIALGQLSILDPSAQMQPSPASASEAERRAGEALADDAAFLCALDLRVLRDSGYRPLGAPALPRKTSSAQPAPEAATPGSSARSTGDRFQTWKERLLDLSLRNKLLNFKPDAKGTLTVEVPDLALFEDLLAAQENLEILGLPEEAEHQSPRQVDPGLRERRLADLRNHTLHCSLTHAQLWDRAQKVDRAARNDQEEGGANTLFAAIGFLRWFETPQSEEGRLAPLLLYPIALSLDRRRKRVLLRRLPEEPVLNVTLIEKLRQDFGLDLSGMADLDPDESGLDVAGLLRLVREAIVQQPRWEVLEQCHAALFTFSRFLLWKDLQDNSQTFLRNDVVRHLVAGGGSFPGKGKEICCESLDEEVSADALPCVVDADSTQMAAIASALTGRSFVLQGPPGTGKSQTITNLIAAALASGRTVLFVSEKMAALEVVHRRLQSVGLGDFCLELHSAKANKKQVLEAFGKSLQRTDREPDFPWQERCTEIGNLRRRLNAWPQALHRDRPLGLSFYQATSRLLSLRSAPELRLPIPHVETITEQQFRQWQEAVPAFAARAAEVEPVASHPWRLTQVSEWSSQLEEALGSCITKTQDSLEALDAAAQGLASALGVPVPPSTAALEDLAYLAWALAQGPVPPAVADTAAWPNIAARIGQYTALQRSLNSRHSELALRWDPGLLRLELGTLRERFQKWAGAFFLFAWWFLRSARRSLQSFARRGLPGNLAIASDLSLACALQADFRAVEQERAWVERAFQGIWSAQTATIEALEAALGRAGAVHEAIRKLRARSFLNLQGALAFASPSTPAQARASVQEQHKRLLDCVHAFESAEQSLQTTLGVQPAEAWPGREDPSSRPTLRYLLAQWRSALPSLRPWCFYQRASDQLSSLGLTSVAEAHRGGTVDAASLPLGFARSLLDRWVNAVRDGDAELRDFDGAGQHQRVERFRELDREHAELSRRYVLRVLEQRLPAPGVAAIAAERDILERELRKKTRHKAIRRLLQEIPELLPRLKPCVLMSPLSVAQFLPAGGKPFDLVVFDEASQIGTHGAIGAIARGNQVLVVGDSKQLPPTSFFTRSSSDDEAQPDDNDVAELESILEEALARQIPQQSLGWHYRSRHDSLIDFSNRHYYGGRLHVFPAARQRVPDLGVGFHPVPDGVYFGGDKGKFARTNPREAEVLVDYLVDTLQKRKPEERSFGVVTFSLAQQTLLQDLLDERRARFPEIEQHFQGPEPLFVKNLESVQGDERDEILFSIGYARDNRGRLRMHFGPLSLAGGERRLNVAITRARCQLRVFSTLTYDQIDLARTASTGASHLRDFLEYAARFGPDSSVQATEERDSPSEIENDVRQAVAALGYQVDAQVGCGGYRIDLAVAHPTEPGVYVLGIECDGPNYHSAKTARDRDRLRRQVLESLGWRMLRIWSPDWWFNPEHELDRIRQSLVNR